MHAPHAYISLILLTATLVKPAPAPLDATTNTGTSLIHPNNLIPSIPNPPSSPLDTICSINSSNPLCTEDYSVHRFAVPFTTTILKVYYWPNIPLPLPLIHSTIATATQHMISQLALYGAGGPLQQADDPYYTPVVPDANCTMRINSQRVLGTEIVPNRLTYQVTLNALSGLHRFLYEEGRGASAVSEVSDPGVMGSFVRIGLVRISPME